MLTPPSFETIDRHYPAIVTLTLLTLVGGAIALAAVLGCNAGEFLGMAVLAVLIVAAIDRWHKAAYDRANGRG